MSVSVIMQFAALAVTVVIGAFAVYAIFETRAIYAEQRDKFVRAISAVEEWRKVQPEFISILQHIESDGHALQKIALQVEVAVAALKDSISSSASAATERQSAAIESFRDHIDTQEERIVRILESISDNLLALPLPQQAAPETKPDTREYSRLRKEVLSQDPELRFSVLKEWISINVLAILHRAGRAWNTAGDLIATIPQFLEAEAEILGECVLLIGTRGHPERLAVPLRDLDSSSDFSQWFDPGSNEQTSSGLPAVLMRSNGHFKLISKGINSQNSNCSGGL